MANQVPADQCDDLNVTAAGFPTDSNILPEPESPARKVARKDEISARPGREAIREQISDYIILMLGGPVVDLELDQQQITLAVDEGLIMFEEWAPSSYFEYFTFETVAGVSVYDMPPDIGMIKQVHYASPSCDAASQLGGAQPLGWIGDTGYGAGGLAWGAWGYNRHQPYWGYGGEWVMFKQYEETFERLSGRNGGWEFFSSDHKIKVYPTPMFSGGTITVHYLQKNKDWDKVHQFMNEYSLALAKIMLGRIRSKYSQIVSPGQGVTLDGQMLLEEGKTEKMQLEKDLVYKWAEPIPINLG